MILESERYDRTYLRIIPMPPSVFKLLREYQEAADELNPNGKVPEGREYTEFYPLFNYWHYVENVKYSTFRYGQDWRTRRFTREELGYGYPEPPCSIKVGLKQEEELRFRFRQERPNWNDKRTIKIEWDGCQL